MARGLLRYHGMRWLVLGLVAVWSACGESGGDADAQVPPAADARIPDAADAPVADAAPAGARVRFGWTLVRDGVVVSCADVGAGQVLLNYGYFDGTDIEVFPCADGEGVTRELPLGHFFVSLAIADPNGIWLVWNDYVALDLLTTPGEVVDVAPLVFEFFDEPEPQLRAIAAGAQAFFPQPVTPDSQFPASTPVTPTISSCCFSLEDVCAPDAALWSGSWQDLAFSVPGRGRWTYSFESSGVGATASFVATAFTDRDCDGLNARYELHGQVDATGMVVVDAEILRVIVNE